MREILFRAKSIKDDNWYYGSFIKSGVDVPCIIYDDGEQVEIKRNTLGQYIGLKDKNHFKIYEGDIIEYKEQSLHSGRFLKEKRVVENIEDIHVLTNLYSIEDITVIGNIHDNSELLVEQV